MKKFKPQFKYYTKTTRAFSTRWCRAFAGPLKEKFGVRLGLLLLVHRFFFIQTPQKYSNLNTFLRLHSFPRKLNRF